MSRRLMLRNASGGGGILPPEYQQVEWIGKETSENQHIALKVPYDAGDRITVKAECFNTQSTESSFAGFSDYANGKWELSFNRGVPSSWAAVEIINTEQIGNAYLINAEFKQYGPRMSFPWYLFQYRENYYYFNGRIYFFSIEKNGEINLALLPCYRKYDGEIGMYDTVSDTFYTNVGTGTFTKGADV